MQDKNKDAISKIIKQQRILLDLTQYELAKKAGVSPTLIRRIEKGERSPSARTLRKLADVLSIGEIELFIHANYLSPTASSRTIGEDTRVIKLDPKVVFELSQEPLKIQRAVLAILKMIKCLAIDISSENVKDDR